MADSQLFRNADGTFTRRVFDRSVHVPGANGAWVPLDLTLARVDGGRIAPRVARWPVSFAGGTATADGDLVRLVLDADHDIAFSPLGVAKVAGRVEGARARYPGTWPRAELELSADAAGVKENLVLAGPPDRSVFEFGLRLRGLTPVLDAGSGDIRLLDGAAVRATIPAGWMRDAHGTVSRNVHYALSAVDGGWRLRMSLDAVWLRTAAYPVVVDPSVQINGDVDDTTVTSGDNANHSGEIDLRVGRDGSGRVSAAYLRFNLGGLANQYVSGATLNLFNAGGAGSCAATATDVYAVGAPWSGGSLRWPGAPLAQHLSRQSFAACAGGRV